MSNKTYHIDTSDEKLLNAYQQSGNMESLGVLYNRYMHLVYGLCLKYLKDRDKSQDAVMGIFEMITQKLEKQQVTYFKSWLYIVSKNYCLMQLRKKEKEQSIDGFIMENESILHQKEETGIEDDLQALEDCIETLKADQQQCVTLFYLKHKSYEEITRDTSFPLKKVKSYLQNGKRNLKNCLESKHVSR